MVEHLLPGGERQVRVCGVLAEGLETGLDVVPCLVYEEVANMANAGLFSVEVVEIAIKNAPDLGFKYLKVLLTLGWRALAVKLVWVGRLTLLL